MIIPTMTILIELNDLEGRTEELRAEKREDKIRFVFTNRFGGYTIFEVDPMDAVDLAQWIIREED